MIKFENRKNETYIIDDYEGNINRKYLLLNHNLELEPQKIIRFRTGIYIKCNTYDQCFIQGGVDNFKLRCLVNSKCFEQRNHNELILTFYNFQNETIILPKDTMIARIYLAVKSDIYYI